MRHRESRWENFKLFWSVFGPSPATIIALVLCEIVQRPMSINDGQPISPVELGQWTPHRVEATFNSGLAVVSSLGPHGNFQYVVYDLDLPVGTTFRNFNGSIMEVM